MACAGDTLFYSLCVCLSPWVSYTCPSSDNYIKDGFYDQGAGILNSPRSVNVFCICEGDAAGAFVTLFPGVEVLPLPPRGKPFYYVLFAVFRERANRTGTSILR